MKKTKYKQQISDTSYELIDAAESDYLYVSNSQIPNTGKGLYTAIQIWKNEIICLFKGEVLSHLEANKRAKKGDDKYFINMLDGYTMDSMHTECYAKYANDTEGHTKTDLKLNAIIAMGHRNSICLVAKRHIKAGTEIFCGYGKQYWVNFNLL